MTLRVAMLIALAFCATAWGNARVVHPSAAEARTYIASEHLTARIGRDSAQFSGTFTFAYRQNEPSLGQRRSMILEIPVWFPEIYPKDPSVAAFWIAFGQQGVVQVSSESRVILEQAIGLRVSLGEEPLTVDELVVLTQSQPGYRWRQKPRVPREWLKERGLGCVVFRFHLKNDSLLTQKPLTISYRQPHYEAYGGVRFFYLPNFNGLPEGASTIDPSLYSITIIAEPECALMLVSGDTKASVEPGQSIAVSPRHHQAIKATVTTRSNKALHATAAAPGS